MQKCRPWAHSSPARLCSLKAGCSKNRTACNGRPPTRSLQDAVAQHSTLDDPLAASLAFIPLVSPSNHYHAHVPLHPVLAALLRSSEASRLRRSTGRLVFSGSFDPAGPADRGEDIGGCGVV